MAKKNAIWDEGSMPRTAAASQKLEAGQPWSRMGAHTVSKMNLCGRDTRSFENMSSW